MDLDSFSYEENDRRYLRPEVDVEETNAFIDNLRNLQQQNNAQIQQDVQNLGTDVPSNLGGLGGGSGYFRARYQTPQTNSLVADLRATAQAQALNIAMNNEIAKAKQRYNQAYRAAKKRASSKPGGSGGDLTSLGVNLVDDGSGEKQTLKFGYTSGAPLSADSVDWSNPDAVADYIYDAWERNPEAHAGAGSKWNWGDPTAAGKNALRSIGRALEGK